MTALILVPTIVGVVLGGARVVASVQSIGDYDRVASAALQAADIRDLVQAIGLERDTAGWIGAAPSVRKKLTPLYNQRKSAVDALVRTVQGDLASMDEAYGQRVLDAVKLARYDLSGLGKVRTQGQKDPSRYEGPIDSLLRVHDELSLLSDDAQIVGQFRALNALAGAKEEVSRQRVQLIVSTYNSNAVDAHDVENFIASSARENSEIASVGAEAGPEFGRLTQQALNKEEYYRTALTKSRAVTLVSGKAPGARLRDDLITEPQQWFNDNTATIGMMASVEKTLKDRVALRGQELRNSETRNAIIGGIAILALLLLVLLLTVAIARSMVTPLRRLRTEALEVAGFRLPDVVRKLRVSGDAAPDIHPIDVEGNDEIGEVAKAFDQVHRQAVRLAGEEADLRSNISSMFVNLSRRTQTLVERQISLIDGLEKGEQDGGRLADLFKLDHLATRMRRNSENLLVLAGHEPTRRRSQPAKLVDVVRAALSEVEGYERVQVKVHRATSVLGSAANDLVHLVAELVENAIQFSPSNTQVTVSSSLIEGGGALVSVSDLGISMTEEELAEANRRLAEPPVVDVSVSRRMGLFVVGRLALRHGIRVQLRKGDGAGLIAMVLLPPSLIPDGTEQPLPQRPAFGGGTVPTSAPAQSNGARRPFPGYDSYGTGPGPIRQGSFNAHTDSGAFGQQSYPSPPPGYHSHPSFPSGSFPPYPSTSSYPSTESGNGAFQTPPPNPLSAPSVDVSPMEQEQEEYLPIFAAVESAWFRKPQAEQATPAVQETPRGDEPSAAQAVPSGEETWRTPADAGWRAAAAASDPSLGGITAAGLPKRTPKANLVPGTAGQAQQQDEGQRPPAPPVSADRVRNRMASFQQGVRRARAERREQEERE
ncbi:sensor histidine kinase [Nonomuraea sediminis]|uniref:sensor histidine kinase n=1 Tax=Nonomuraea sediminis TaxID=2835864 RepID=UPI001BDDC275|nr:nitrate- and nitrite sensing domain-containing protein [Nonomuraea sediminis]